MTVLTLDETLTETEWNEKRFPREQIKLRIEKQCIAGDAVRHDWKAKTITETEIVFASAVPDDAYLYHNNYLQYLSRTYSHHNSIVLAPQHFWYVLSLSSAQPLISSWV